MPQESAQRDNENSKQLSMQDIEALLKLIFPIPRIWILMMCLAAIVSLVEVTREPSGGITVTGRVTAITASLVALVWLPALLKIIALVGGGIKTPAGEVSTEGLLDILQHSDAATKRETLPGVIGALTIAKGRAPEVEVYRNLLQNELNKSIAPNSQKAQKDLMIEVNKYKQLRELPFGDDRTIKRSTIAARLRALVSKSNLTTEELLSLSGGDEDIGAILLVAYMQSNPDSHYFENILKEVEKPRGPQEQYQALQALETMLPSLKREQRERLAKVIRNQEYIKPENQGRWAVSQKILSKIAIIKQ